MTTPTHLAVASLAAGLALATISDLRTRRIPNELTATMVATGLLLAALGSSGVPLIAAAFGAALGLGLMLPGYALGATGAGDVKLMAAVGAIVGPGLVVEAFVLTALAGGLLAVLIALQRRRLSGTLARTAWMIARPTTARADVAEAGVHRRFAYGPAIAVGSVLAVLVG